MATATAQHPVSATTIGADTSAESLQLSVQHGKKIFNLTMPRNTTLKILKEEIMKETQVPPSFQKLMCKGKLLKDDAKPLEEQGVSTKSKIVCIGNTLESVISATSTVDVKAKPGTAEAKKEEAKISLSQTKEHEKIVAKGVPPDAEKGFKDRNEPLPKSIKGLLNRQGNPVRLTFKNETQELWISTKDDTQRIPYVQIRDIDSEAIHSAQDYFIMSFQLGNLPNNKVWIYYIPAQYVKAIRYTVLGGGSSAFPFLHSV